MRPTSESPAASQRHQTWTPLLEVAAREVFELMLGCQLTEWSAEQDVALDITAMVGLAGQMCGLLSLRCDQESATLMASKMLGLEPHHVGTEMGDAIGEVCNMVAGNFKNKISGMESGCMLSVPTVITGTNYNLYSHTDSPGLEVRLLFESKPVVISLQIRG
ncbi:MAG: chemotaxis protein CheX [Candidatus Sulfotelmatobacter sp.]|jgi:chemotaxis protein CheX